MTDEEFSVVNKVELSVVDVLALTKGVDNLAQMQINSLKFVINLKGRNYVEADKALGEALASFAVVRASSEQLVAHLAKQVAPLQGFVWSGQDKTMEDTNLRKWMNQLDEARMRQTDDQSSSPTARPDTLGGMDAIRQSLENRLAHLHGDVDILGRKLDNHFRWLVGVYAVGVVLMVGVTAAGILYLADQLAG